MLLKPSIREFPPLVELVSLRSRKALITGSAPGIGTAVAYRLAEAGADPHLVDVETDEILTYATAR